MGFFNYLFKGLGFESDKKAKQPDTSIIEGDDLVKKQESPLSMEEKRPYVTEDIKISAPVNTSNNFEMGNTNMLVHVPKSNKDIQLIVDTLRRRESAIVNLGALSQADASKIIDFLSGAVYALKGNLRRLEGDLFLLTPEGINVVSPDEQGNADQ